MSPQFSKFQKTFKKYCDSSKDLSLNNWKVIKTQTNESRNTHAKNQTLASIVCCIFPLARSASPPVPVYSVKVSRFPSLSFRWPLAVPRASCLFPWALFQHQGSVTSGDLARFVVLWTGSTSSEAGPISYLFHPRFAVQWVYGVWGGLGSRGWCSGSALGWGRIR